MKVSNLGYTTAPYLHEPRGVQISLDEVFDRKKAGKVLEFKKEKKKRPLTSRGLSTKPFFKKTA
jgi:hypothetical protein